MRLTNGLSASHLQLYLSRPNNVQQFELLELLQLQGIVIFPLIHGKSFSKVSNSHIIPTTPKFIRSWSSAFLLAVLLVTLLPVGGGDHKSKCIDSSGSIRCSH